MNNFEVLFFFVMFAKYFEKQISMIIHYYTKY